MTDSPPPRTHQAAFDEIQRVLAGLPDEAARKDVLEALLVDRCRQCLDYDPNATRTGRWCCYDSRGG